MKTFCTSCKSVIDVEPFESGALIDCPECNTTFEASAARKQTAKPQVSAVESVAREVRSLVYYLKIILVVGLVIFILMLIF